MKATDQERHRAYDTVDTITSRKSISVGAKYACIFTVLIVLE